MSALAGGDVVTLTAGVVDLAGATTLCGTAIAGRRWGGGFAAAPPGRAMPQRWTPGLEEALPGNDE